MPSLTNRSAQKLSAYILSFLGALSLVLLLQSTPTPAQLPGINQAIISQILDKPQVYIQNKLAKVQDSAGKGQRIRTQQARAELLFNTGAVGRLAQNSILTVGQCARLQQGSLLINGATSSCSPSAVASVRGTTYLMEVSAAGETQIKVLEGEVVVTQMPTTEEVEASLKPTVANKQVKPERLPDPLIRPSDRPLPIEPFPQDDRPILQTQTGSQVVLKEGEKVSLSAKGIIGTIEKLSQNEFTNILTGQLFNGFPTQLPGISNVQGSFQRLFPGIPFPVSLPGVPVPRIPIPRLPF